MYPVVDAAGEVVSECYADGWREDFQARFAMSGDKIAMIAANKATALAVANDDDTPADDRTAILAMYAQPEPAAAAPTAQTDIFPGDLPPKGAKASAKA